MRKFLRTSLITFALAGLSMPAAHADDYGLETDRRIDQQMNEDFIRRNEEETANLRNDMQGGARPYNAEQQQLGETMLTCFFSDFKGHACEKLARNFVMGQ